jgi:hypothetical protein
MRSPEPAADLDRLVVTSIVVWTSWITHLSALRPRPDITRADVVEGALLSFLVVAPFLDTAFATSARAVIERHRTS